MRSHLLTVGILVVLLSLTVLYLADLLPGQGSEGNSALKFPTLERQPEPPPLAPTSRDPTDLPSAPEPYISPAPPQPQSAPELDTQPRREAERRFRIELSEKLKAFGQFDLGTAWKELTITGEFRTGSSGGMGAVPPAPQLVGITKVAQTFPSETDDTTLPYYSEPLKPIPLEQGLDLRKVALGARLFADPQLSVDHRYRCLTCHDLGRGGVDGRRRPLFRSGVGKRNVPTLFNSRFNLAYAWDGRFNSIDGYIEAVLTDPKSFGFNWPGLIDRLGEDKEYVALFKESYPDGINRKSVVDALATYVRSLTTPGSRFDRYLRGETRAMSRRKRKGYGYFKHYGCATCHNGVAVGGNLFQPMGVIEGYLGGKGEAAEGDRAWRRVGDGTDDRHWYKVPSLRLASRTAPYFHDGSVATLEQAIELMGRYQIGRRIPAEHVELIVEFLETLADSPNLFRP